MDNTSNFKILKLKTGETILCKMNSTISSITTQSHIEINDPVQVIPHKENVRQGQVLSESFLMRPWIGLSDSEDFILNVDIVLTIGNIKQDVKRQYVQYLQQAQETRDKHERSDAADDLLREVAHGDLRIIDIDDDLYFQGDCDAETQKG